MNANFQKWETFDKHLSIEEMMIRYYSHRYFKQYIKGKPIRFWYKMRALCGNNGYCYNFDLYCCKEVVDAASTVVLSKEPLGTRVDVKNKITAVKWHDNKCVTLATSIDIIESPTSVSRREKGKAEKNKIEHSCPVNNYNQNMGGVDYHDWLLEKHTIKIRGNKWYWLIFSRIVDMPVINTCSILQHGKCREKKYQRNKETYCNTYLKKATQYKNKLADQVTQIHLD
ncbi:piggyBac transposable element-derived protein 2 [Trichonephila clavipes]|nr:piggyBac transposable element-derived protein 2 [Trichonephila clavipes]